MANTAEFTPPQTREQLSMPSWEFFEAEFPNARDLLPDGVDPERSLVDPITNPELIKVTKEAINGFIDSGLPPADELQQYEATGHSDEPLREIGVRRLAGVTIRATVISDRMKDYSPNGIYVRDSVIPELENLGRALADPELAEGLHLPFNVTHGVQLLVQYGLRPRKIQQQSFDAEVERLLAEGWDPTDMDAVHKEANMHSASPPVASHPTGGSFDFAGADDRGYPVKHGQSELYPKHTDRAFSPFVEWEIGAAREWHRRGAARTKQIVLYGGEANVHGEVRGASPEGVWYARNGLMYRGAPRDLSRSSARYDVFVPRNGFPLRKSIEYPVAA
jgi:hypothetical protein